jgi:hypothetical protein
LNTHFEWIGQALGFFSTAIQVQLLCSVLTGILCGLPSFGMPRLHSCLVRQRATKVDIAYAIVFINSSIALIALTQEAKASRSFLEGFLWSSGAF